MLILSNGLTDMADEGYLKVANSLVKRIKKAKPDTYVVSYERKSDLTDCYLNLNKLLINKKLISLIKSNSSLLYIPFPAKTFWTALRVFILSLFSRTPVNVILVMKSKYNPLAKLLLRISGANIIVLSKDAEDYYKEFVKEDRVTYLKCGVDTKKFVPVSKEKADALKEKYGFDNRPVVLHVGHLKAGRNVGELAKIDEHYQALLVTSTRFKESQESALKEELLKHPNIKIMDDYIENIEEIYQLCDVYFFPVKESGNCIDVPLSVMEAAACNKPVITTDYGEMKELINKDGFYLIREIEKNPLNELIENILDKKSYNTRETACEYDWDNAVERLCKL